MPRGAALRQEKKDEKGPIGSSPCDAVETNLTSIHEDVCFDPWPHSAGRGSSIAVSCGVGRRFSLDLLLLWL